MWLAGRSDQEFNTARDVIDSSGSSARDSGTGRDQFLSARGEGEEEEEGGGQAVGNLMPKQYDAARVFSKVRHNRFEEVQKLLEEGLPVDATDDNGNAMLHIACQNGHRRLAKVLLRGGANMNAQNNKVSFRWFACAARVVLVFPPKLIEGCCGRARRRCTSRSRLDIKNRGRCGPAQTQIANPKP